MGSDARTDRADRARAEALAATPLFAALGAGELERIAAVVGEVSLAKGEVVCREGEEGDRLFVLTSGELEVWAGPEPGRFVNRIVAGELFGEMSLLTGSPRTATVKVSRAARLLTLDKAAFEQLCLDNPKVLEFLSRVLARRLATSQRGEATRQATTTVAVTGAPGLKGRTLVATTLASLLESMTGAPAVLVSSRWRGGAGGGENGAGRLDELAQASAELVAAAVRTGRGRLAELALGAPGEGGEAAIVERLASLVARLGERFRFVVFDLGAADAPLAAAVEEVSDALIEIVASATPGPATGSGVAAVKHRRLRVVNRHNPASPRLPIGDGEPYVIPDERAIAGLDPAAQAAWLRENPFAPAARPLHRLARKLLGATVGLALGGGAAFGIAHVGVLAVLEEHGIPIDLVAGTSMGSIIGVGYASGLRPREMIELARQRGNMRTFLSALWDFTLTRPSLLSGDKMIAIFMGMAGDVDSFDELVVPCRAVATDIETGERVAIGSGRLEDACRASAAVPIVWSPVKLDGRVLVDGGVVDPVPAEVVRDMGADLCVAVNVVPSLKKGVETAIARWYRRVNRLNPVALLAGAQGLPSMFDQAMASMQLLQHELGNFKAIAADVRINCDLSEFTWIEFYRAMELIERGREAALHALPEIERLLADRLRPS